MPTNYRAELTGVFGDPVDGNPTGVMEEAAYAAKGLNFRYITMRVTPEHLKDAFLGAKAVGMRGMNLTMPHKIMIIPYLDKLTKAAEIIGAVNTVYEKDGQWIGENTDGKGFVEALLHAGGVLDGARVTILGAGGAARAIAVECALAGASHVTVINRNEKRGKELVDVLNEKAHTAADFVRWEAGQTVPADTDILIQATSVGLHPNDTEKPDIDYDTITGHMTACDVVFNPAETAFLKEAAKRGAKCVGGLGMLARQGALNFTLWTGVEAPIDVMEAKLKSEFAQD